MLFGCDSDSSYSVEDDAVVVPVVAALSIAESAHSGRIGHVAGAAAKPDACGTRRPTASTVALSAGSTASVGQDEGRHPACVSTTVCPARA